jgi:ATP-dependent Clp protease ATP-binding subunit ClpA
VCFPHTHTHSTLLTSSDPHHHSNCPRFERFTEKAIKVVMLAQEEARRLGHNFVGTEQLLLGLIGESTGIAAKVLKSMGVNLKDARVEVEKIIGRGSGFVAVEIPFTPRAKRVLEMSLEEARQLGESKVDGRLKCFLEWDRLRGSTAAACSWPFGSVVRYLRVRNGPSEVQSEKQIVRFALCCHYADIVSTLAGHNYIGTEHILLGLLREGEGVAARVLETLGADPAKIRTQVCLGGYMRLVCVCVFVCVVCLIGVG